jgi:glycerate kinase
LTPTTILVCPTAFKGTLSARAAAEAMARGAREAISVHDPDVRVLPLSDGGNGLMDMLSALHGGETWTVEVTGPLGSPVTARFLLHAGRAVVETAEACGLHLVPPGRRDPLVTTTRGVGELLREAAAALEAEGGGRLVVGLGGSATVDAGAGMLQALGWRLLDDEGDPIPPGGSGLLRIARILPPPAPVLPAADVLADVNNLLLGPAGAARVYGPQKGASPRDVRVLENALARWAAAVERHLGVAVADRPGAGAAGGLGAAFAALGSPPVPGAGWLLERAGFAERLADARAVVTGEGCWDEQSSMGKITGEVVRRALSAGTPVLVVAGSIRAPLPPGAWGVPGSVSDRLPGEPGSVPPLDEEALARHTRQGLNGLLARGRRP